MLDHFSRQPEAHLSNSPVTKADRRQVEQGKVSVFMPMDLVFLIIIGIVTYSYFQPDEPEPLSAIANLTENSPAGVQQIQPAATLMPLSHETIAANTDSDNKEANSAVESHLEAPPEATLIIEPLSSEPLSATLAEHPEIKESTDASPPSHAALKAGIQPEQMQVIASEAGKPITVWAINLLSTPSQSTAERINKQLQADGTQSEVVAVHVDARTLYRVRVSNFASKQQADTAMALFRTNSDYKHAWLSRRANTPNH